MRFNSVQQWLDWQMVLHGKAIELGLDRVRQVADNMGLRRMISRVITVAGTNGKGSSVAAYETWLSNAGYRVASYTSPHLMVYNERIKHQLQPVGDADLCLAFAAVDAARDDISLTYFEFGTLAALYLIQLWQPEYAVLEVGLGGRLDAVNIVDPDLAHLTPIGIDHQAWLGDSRNQIGFEKAGILRDRIPVVLNDPDPPQSVLEEIARRRCQCLRLNDDYRFNLIDDNRLLWHGQGLELQLDRVLRGKHQALNLAGVVAGLSVLLPLQDYPPAQVNTWFQGTRIAGRLEEMTSPLPGRLFCDVGHNPDAALALAASLSDLKPARGRLVVLLGMLEDKQADAFVRALRDQVDLWWLLTLDCDRGLKAAVLHERVRDHVEVEKMFASAGEALAHALSNLGNQDIMLVTGSFVTVEMLQRELSDSGEQKIYGSKH